MISVTVNHYVCFDCAASYAPSAERIRCDCGGVLDLPLIAPAHRQDDAVVLRPLYWAVDWALERAGLGDGHTPLLRWSDASDVWLKCDHMLPTGSFKDRGARSLVAHALELGIDEIVVDSSGNAGAALAGHAARAGIKCMVFVPHGTSASKIAQIRSYGAAVTLVAGPRENSETAALAYAAAGGVLYASHSTNSYFHDGTKSWFYEVVQQLPGVNTVVLPVGSGSLLLGVIRAIGELTSSGWISSPPRVILAQAEGFDSLRAAPGRDQASVRFDAHPIAEGIAIRNPARRRQLIELMRQVSATVSVVSSREIIAAKQELGQSGFYVEPTSAAAWAAWRKSGSDATTVVALTGHGLKTAA